MSDIEKLMKASKIWDAVIELAEHIDTINTRLDDYIKKIQVRLDALERREIHKTALQYIMPPENDGSIVIERDISQFVLDRQTEHDLKQTRIEEEDGC